MTREDFIAHWRINMAGLALYGSMSNQQDGPMARAGRAMAIIPEVETWLGQMFDSVVPPAPKTVPTQATPPVKPATTVPVPKPSF